MSGSNRIPGPFVKDDCHGSPAVRQFGRWTLHEYPETDSTNLRAAALPGWHAVRSDRQTAGRGRFQRSWVSDEGGLWLSMVLPVTGAAARLLPLAAGLAVCDAVQACGLRDIRLRWPNDVLVSERKLAGLLIDQFVPGLAVAGVGLNVNNSPEEHDVALRGRTARLADLIEPVPTLTELTHLVLRSVERIAEQLVASGAALLLPRINALWRAPYKVQLDLDGRLVDGQFEGVDAAGHLQLRAGASGALHHFEPHQVRLLREIQDP